MTLVTWDVGTHNYLGQSPERKKKLYQSVILLKTTDNNGYNLLAMAMLVQAEMAFYSLPKVLSLRIYFIRDEYHWWLSCLGVRVATTQR